MTCVCSVAKSAEKANRHPHSFLFHIVQAEWAYLRNNWCHSCHKYDRTPHPPPWRSHMHVWTTQALSQQPKSYSAISPPFRQWPTGLHRRHCKSTAWCAFYSCRLVNKWEIKSWIVRGNILNERCFVLLYSMIFTPFLWDWWSLGILCLALRHWIEDWCCYSEYAVPF